ncbi:hypothetical protein B4U79_16832 [Dinothrombium tinctorium]|uniref:B30.2/SPRY domain-containing protein n=1 Tax=Dinothrombium tinctorium TaxID=1965070 RepID=A0A3S3PZM8_9ACAR|nr:hypothetical protein B4U79_16832 [Dinothrombium tinctorium]
MSWVCQRGKEIRAKDNKVTVTDGGYFNVDRKLNAYFKPETGGFETGKHYFEFHFDLQREGAFVGATKKVCFGSGYSLKGLMYGGNLADGSCLLVCSFGERITGKDKVGILLDLTEDELKMYVFHNDHPLGLAFHITKPYPKPLFPVVSIGGPGSVSIIFPKEMPTTLNRTSINYTGIEGNWRIERCEKAGNLLPNFTDKWKHYTLNVSKSGSRENATPNYDSNAEEARYHISFHVGNTIWCTMKKENGKWSMEGPCSTLVCVYEDENNAEMFLGEFLAKFLDFSVNDDTLVLNGNDDSKITLKRFDPEAPGPYTGNPCERRTDNKRFNVCPFIFCFPL